MSEPTDEELLGAADWSSGDHRVVAMATDGHVCVAVVEPLRPSADLRFPVVACFRRHSSGWQLANFTGPLGVRARRVSVGDDDAHLSTFDIRRGQDGSWRVAPVDAEGGTDGANSAPSRR